MLFEKILELLAALVVAIAGIVGINVAAEHADRPANDAATKAASGLSRAAEARAEHAALGPADGLARALDALTQAAENAPAQADQGLDRAIDAVTNSPAGDAPAGPPAELPGGRP